MTNQAGRDWRLVVLTVGSGAAALAALASAAFGFAYLLLDPLLPGDGPAGVPPLNIYVILSALVLIGALLAIVAFRSGRALAGQPNPVLRLKPLRFVHLAALLLAWLACSSLSSLVAERSPWSWSAPLFHVLAIGIPIFLLVRLMLGGRVDTSAVRVWGSLATGMVLGIGIAAMVEVALMILAAGVAIIYLVANPEQLLAAQELASRLSTATGLEDSMSILQPLLAQPLVLAIALLAVAVVTPFVEELAKSVAPWLIFRELQPAATGFLCGAISGAGFALFEGLMASSDAPVNWAAISIVRGWSSTMHVLASALAGWGIAAFRAHGGMWRLAAGYGSAMGIHALWNGSVVMMGFGSLRYAMSMNPNDLGGTIPVALGAVTMTALIVTLPVATAVLSNRFRSQPAESAA